MAPCKEPGMSLITAKDKMPAMRSQESVRDPMVQVKLFTPWSGWTWLLTEYDPSDKVAFGFCYNSSHPDGAELGYVDLTELESLRGPGGLRIEKDIGFKPMVLSQAKKQECPALR